MPRPRRIGRIFFNPSTTYFKPAGISIAQLKETILTKEELEVIRLIDYENQSQTKVAKEMKISQPTLSRLLTSARKKIADALVNGKAIKIQGGVYKIVTRKSGAGFGNRKGRMGGIAAGPSGKCICQNCGATAPHQMGIPCTQQKCPRCNNLMVRK